jgi:hypothetical protein
MDTRDQPQAAGSNRPPSRSRRRPLLWLTAALVVLGLGVFFIWDREPAYRGKRLSQWLESVASSSELDDTKSSEAAIRQIGVRGLPCLLRWIRYEPRTGKGEGVFRSLVDKLPPRLRSNRVLYQFMEDKAGRRAAEAEIGLAILGPQAAPAVPHLTWLVRRYTSTNTSLAAMRSLGCIGKAGLAPLIAAAEDRQFPNRVAAVATIGMNFRGTNGLPALPVLIQCTGDRDARLARAAILALGTMSAEPETVIPVLTNRLHEPKPELRRAAVYALGSFKSQAAQLVPALREVLERDPDPGVRSEAVAVAGKFKDQAAEIVPLLNTATKDSDQNVREAANEALRSGRDAARYFD